MASQIKRLLYVNFYKLTKFEQIFPEYSQTFLKLFSRYILMKFSATKQSKWIFNHWCFLIEKIVLIFAVFSLKDDRIKSFFSKKKNFFWKKAMSINVSTLTFFLRASHLRCTQICFPFALLTQLRHVPQLSFRWQGTHFPHAFRFLRATELGFYWKLKNFYLSIVTVETTGHAIKVQKRRRREREA